MRYIHLDDLEFPTGWKQRAVDALAELKKAADKKGRDAVIKKYQNIWADLKDALAKLSYSKCWYSQSSNVGADNTVDHFRPKRRVAEAAQLPEGYWWLAFSFDNYRFCCTLTNSLRTDPDTKVVGGKEDHFPLLTDSTRALSEADDLGLEEVELLDPVKRADPPLLWFDDNGRAQPRYDPPSDPASTDYRYRRASTSILFYNLNHKRFRDARKQLANQVIALINDGKREFAKAKAAGTATTDALELVKAQLHQAMDHHADFSVSARCIIAGRREPGQPWIDELIVGPV